MTTPYKKPDKKPYDGGLLHDSHTRYAGLEWTVGENTVSADWRRAIRPSLDALAERVLVTGALRLGTFRLRSGAESDHYFDVKRVLLDPAGLSLASRCVVRVLCGLDRTGGRLDAVGGPELGAIPLVGATIVGFSTQGGESPRGFMVRKATKEYGTGQLIEGDVRPGESVAILEDVVTTGGSVLKAIDAVEAAGARCRVVIAVVDRGGDVGRRAIEGRGVEFAPLLNGDDILAMGRAKRV